MNRKGTIAVLLWFFAAAASTGQTARITSESDLLSFMNSDLQYRQNQREWYNSVEGSAYLDTSFLEGTISVGGTRYDGLLLRFNPFEEAVEFQKEGQIRYFMPHASRSDTVWIGDDILFNVVRRDGKNLKSAFMKRAGGEETRVLVFHEVRVTEPKPAQGYEDPSPARFLHRPEQIYIQVPGKPAIEFKGKKSLEDVFGEDHGDLEDYARSNRYRLKSLEEVLALCSYYDRQQDSVQSRTL